MDAWLRTAWNDHGLRIRCVSIGDTAVCRMHRTPGPRTYRLPSTSRRFTSCAFGTGAPSECPSDSSLTAHPTLMNKTMGVLGYGNIGQAGPAGLIPAQGLGSGMLL